VPRVSGAFWADAPAQANQRPPEARHLPLEVARFLSGRVGRFACTVGGSFRRRQKQATLETSLEYGARIAGPLSTVDTSAHFIPESQGRLGANFGKDVIDTVPTAGNPVRSSIRHHRRQVLVVRRDRAVRA